jgi:hypothetical protein
MPQNINNMAKKRILLKWKQYINQKPIIFRGGKLRILGQIAALNDGEFIIVSSGAILLLQTVCKS